MANTGLYSQFVHSLPGAFIAKQAGLPVPPPLRRYKPSDPALTGPVLPVDVRDRTQVNQLLDMLLLQLEIKAESPVS